MLLAVDIGNTQTHIGVFDGERLAHEWRAATEGSRTADELALMFGQFLAMAELSFSRQITGMCISSVVPKATQELRQMTQRYFGFPPVVVEPGTKTGISIMYDNPREVGADRIANAVAAHHLFPGSDCVMVDFGTAITVDAVTSKGQYLGGAIAPGIETAASALFSSAAQILRVEVTAPPNAIGKNTRQSVQSGLVFGTAALVDGLVDRIASELDGDVEVLATGGLAPVVTQYCDLVKRIEPLLTLIGLRLIFDRNAAPSAEEGNV